MPVILATGFLGDIGEDSLRAFGIAEVLMKPFTLQSLAQSLKRVVNQ